MTSPLAYDAPNDSVAEVNRERFHTELRSEKYEADVAARRFEQMRVVSTLPKECYRNATVVPARFFMWNHTARSFVTELSDLNMDQPVIKPLGPGGPNNLGFLMLNEKTCGAVPFKLLKVDGMEGEVSGWRLAPTADALRADPLLTGLTTLIIND